MLSSYLSYPSEETIYRSYNERCAWEKLKSTHLQSTVNSIQEKCIRHNISFAENMPQVERPLTPARVDSSPSGLKRFDQYLSFVYGSHKVREGEIECALTSLTTKKASSYLQNGDLKEINSSLSQGTRKKVTFGNGD